VNGVQKIGSMFVGQTNPPSKLAKIQDKFMFGEQHMSDIHQVVWFPLLKVERHLL
jgi:hypothetical protein